MPSYLLHSRRVLACLFLSACARPSAPQQVAPEQAPPAAPPTAADEPSYRATGTEPFWGLAVMPRELRVTYPEPEPAVASSYSVEDRPDGRTYRGNALTVTVTFKRCSDGMSDRVYPHTVKIELGDRILHGCGWPAGYDLGPPP